MIDEFEIRATVIAHAIRLGKPFQVGERVDFNIQLRQIEEEDLVAGRFDRATEKTPTRRVMFTVTREDIERGKALINEQRAQYQKPKTTIVRTS